MTGSSKSNQSTRPGILQTNTSSSIPIRDRQVSLSSNASRPLSAFAPGDESDTESQAGVSSNVAVRIDPSTGGGSLPKGKGFPRRVRSTSRSKSRQRLGEDDDDDDEYDDTLRPMSPVARIQRERDRERLDQDDEVRPIDRGEELVRQRMQERRRKEREAARKAKFKQTESHRGSILEDFCSSTPRKQSVSQSQSEGVFGSSVTQSDFTEREPVSEAGSVHVSRRYQDDQMETGSVTSRPDNQNDQQEGQEYDDDDDDDDDSGDNPGEVEYTLKDRQDAINLEHPFGLPIWKPALYKKSRSVTRNAETALHEAPSAQEVYDLAPVNIVWIILFGLPLAAICILVGCVMWFVPWGGEKYGRVLIDLGGYLLWPFGRYVARVVKRNNDDDSCSDMLENEHDVEDGGATYGRRSLHSDSSVRKLPNFGNPSTSEQTGLTSQQQSTQYGAINQDDDMNRRSSSEETISANPSPSVPKATDNQFRIRALGRIMYWVVFYLFIAPTMLLICLMCWGLVFTIPMAKLLWVLLEHLNSEPLSLHFNTPARYGVFCADDETSEEEFPIRAGQPAPKVSRKSLLAAKANGRIVDGNSTVLLCTYRAMGLQYYKYTVDGVNIIFINLMSLVFFVIFDFFFIEPIVKHHELGGFLGFIASQEFLFLTALLSVIPLSYFIGQAVASISAQSSIGMGAVINASFGSIIEIILYSIALTQSKGKLVEGSLVGSLLAGVLLMPGCSMIGGAMRRKEQKFNARSAGVTSTMLIMAIIGILTPTMFYEIYGSFQLTCSGCHEADGGFNTCDKCYYEHVDPADDPFYQNTVRALSYWCAVLLVLSYLVGLWFSLRTHASQIWQNTQTESAHKPIVATDRQSIYKRIIPANLMGKESTTPIIAASAPGGKSDGQIPSITLPPVVRVDEESRAHSKEHSKVEEEDSHGGHDAPNWSRTKSASVLMACTILYAIIAEILVDVVDVVLEGSGIPEKFLGITLFALVPNTTEFMNAISFAINGNIALSMEIGSAYALQVCLIQIPAMLAFSAYYAIGQESLNHKVFTMVFPRWDVIAIVFSVFLLTYTYIEARSNYYRGSILCLSYLVLLGGFAFAPAPQDDPDIGTVGLLTYAGQTMQEHTLSLFQSLQAFFLTLFTS